MDRNNRPQGRETRKGTNTGSVGRQGGGLGTGPVGNSGGFNRPSQPSRPASSSSSGSNWGNQIPTSLGRAPVRSSPGRKGGLGKSIKRIFTLLLIVAVAFVVISICFTGQDNLISGSSGAFSGNMTGGSFSSLFSGGSGDNSAPDTAYRAHDVDRSVAPAARDKYTKLKGGGQDKVTLLIYMCATDLESRHGMATADLNEIAQCEYLDRMNVIIYTGGCNQWQNSVISSNVNQIYRFTSSGLTVLEKDAGRKAMTDVSTLVSFIQYGQTNYPADRYFLIMWDHGGGTVAGYGYDEKYPGGGMTLDQFGNALRQGGIKFDFVGFDACLMATLETAVVCEPYADYMIASEATEPGTGWYYTKWLDMLGSNTSTPTVDIGKQIIDDFIADSKRKQPGSQTTLSLVDLAEFGALTPESLSGFAASVNTLIDNNDYQRISDARSGSRDFSSGSQINQIDLIHFAVKLNTPQALALIDTLRGCVKYNRCDNITNANGLSIYFPLQSINKVEKAINTYKKIGMDSAYTDCIRSFASLAAGGQIVANETGGTDIFGMLLGGSGSSGSSLSSQIVTDILASFIGSPSSSTYSSGSDNGFSLGDILSWFDSDRAMRYAGSYADSMLTPDSLRYEQKNGNNVLVLSDSQWDMVKSLTISVYLDDGSGYINLGLDNVLSYDDDGDLILDYPGDWIALNGQVVPYYLISEEYEGNLYRFTGYVPAFVNGLRMNLVISFDSDDPYGSVIGAVTDYSSDVDVAAKIDVLLNKGDKIELICDYFDYTGNYLDSYKFGDTITVPGDGLVIENVPTGNFNTITMFRIIDIYGNEIWTKGIEG